MALSPPIDQPSRHMSYLRDPADRNSGHFASTSSEGHGDRSNYTQRVAPPPMMETGVSDQPAHPAAASPVTDSSADINRPTAPVTTTDATEMRESGRSSSHSHGTLVQSTDQRTGSSHEKTARQKELAMEHGFEDDDGPVPKYSSGFLDSRMKPLRGTFFKTLLLGALLTVIAIFAVLPIYWGALWNTPNEVPGLNGFIVDFDQGQIGQLVTQSLLQSSGNPSHMTWAVMTNSFTDSEQVKAAVVDNQAWAAVVINAGATTGLANAIATLDASYNGSYAVAVFTEGARNQYATQYITAAYQNPLMMAQQMFASQHASQLAATANLPQVLATVPQAVTLPWSYLNYDLRPFDVPVANAVVFVGLIYVVIFAFVLTMQAYNARQPLIPYLNLRTHITLRLLTPIFGYFLLSISYALVSLAFQCPFERYYGRSGFVIYWMLCFVMMLALGFALEAMITLLTPAFISFFLILWIISNVSIAFYPIELLPGVFKYGYAMPFYQFSETSRAVIFGTKDKIGQNFGILIAWWLVSCCTMTLFTVLTHRRGLQKHKRTLEEKHRA